MALTRCTLVLAAVLAVVACEASDEPPAATFAPRRSWPTGLPARALAVLDGSRNQIALAFPLQDKLGILDAAGGDLNPAAARGDGPMAILSLDVDGDGRLELVAANAGDATLTLLAPADQGLEVLASTKLTQPAKHLVGADLDGDGRQEIVVTTGLDDPAVSGIELWRWDGAGLVRTMPAWDLPDSFAAMAGDVDADGDLDVVAVLQLRGEIVWAVNDGRGVLTSAGRLHVCDAPRAATLVGGRVAVACRDGLALVDMGAPGGVTLVPHDGNVYDLAGGDFDGDGQDDLAAVDLDHDAVVLWPGLGAGGLGAPALFPVGEDPVAIVAADLGADGDLDLVVSAYATRTIDILHNVRFSDERLSP